MTRLMNFRDEWIVTPQKRSSTTFLIKPRPKTGGYVNVGGYIICPEKLIGKRIELVARVIEDDGTE